MERRFTILVTFVLLICAVGFTSAQSSSVLSSGNWYKIPISESGVYKLSYDYLAAAGLPIDDIDPNTIRVFGNSGGMLPQANSVDRSFGLVETPLLVSGGTDNSFDNTDYILFYASGPHAHEYIEGELQFEYNIYSDLNYYFITYGGDQGLSIETVQSMDGSFPTVTNFNDFKHHEIEMTNLLISGREWYGERFDLTTERDFTFDFEGIISNSDIKVTVDVMTQSFEESSFDVSINESMIGSQTVDRVQDFLNPLINNPFRYSTKGTTSNESYTGSANGNVVNVGLSYNKTSSVRSMGYLNYLDVEVERALALYGSQTNFRSLQSLENSNSTYVIGDVSEGNLVWNITNPESPFNQEFQLADNIARFGAESNVLQEYIVFDPTQISTPNEDISSIPNQDLKGLSASEFIIISHPDFLTEAERLASFRRSNDGLTVSVVTTEQVFNEFSSGKQDVTALRDFVRYHYDKTNGQLQYLLLFGKGSYDYKDVLANNKNFVPIYESYNSLHPLDTYASDDFFGFLEQDEGLWEEVRGGNHTLDIGVGRFPVSTIEEAAIVVDKAIQYSSGIRSLGSWRNELVFVADDGDFNLHQRQADQLTDFVDTTFIDFNSNKLFLDQFPQVSGPSGQTSPQARKALEDIVEKGALIVNFTGHGGELGWMQEEVLDLFLIDEFKNRNRLPLFVTATCEFGRHDDPKRVSGGERIVTNERGGGIALVSTCRPVSSSSNFALNKAFYTTLFEQENNEFLRLGDIFRRTKNASVDLASDFKRVGNRNFALLGDPSLRLAYPKNEIVITGIFEGENPSDTLKALAKTKIVGEIRSQNNVVLNDFNGSLDITVFDNDVAKTTLGNENPPFNFSVKENKLFQGSVSVINGNFEVNFVVPKNISQRFENGKISLYASENSSTNDANGANISVSIGGTAENPESDTTPPDIQLYMGDTLSNKTTGISHNTTLFARLSDTSGINISGFGISNSIVATLDGDQKFILNDFYQSKKDDFTEGWVSFPISDLTEGEHTIELKAADTYNNIGTQEIKFVVANPNSVLISQLKNYPNPVRDRTTISFNHNRSGDDLEVSLQIISSMGDIVRDIDFKIDDSAPLIELFEWDGSGISNEKLTQGIYLYRVSVRSLQDGAKGQEFQKLILIK